MATARVPEALVGEKLLFSVRQVSEILTLSYAEVYREIARGNLRSLVVGKRVRRISKAALLEWIARREAMTAA